MAREEMIELPSGLKGRVRNMAVDELNALTDRAGMRTGESFETILRKCWMHTEDSGRAFPDGPLTTPRPFWKKMLASDRFVALIRIRALTWGDTYKFTQTCPECGERSATPCEIKLSELPIRPLPDASAAQIREGTNRFEVWLPDPDGRVPPDDFAPAIADIALFDAGEWSDDFPSPKKGWAVALCLMTGDGEVTGALEARKNPKKRITVSLKHRIIEVMHEDLSSRGDPEAVGRWVDQLNGEICNDLLDLSDELDGGIETEWDGFTCMECGFDDEVELPFSGRAFWMPKRQKRKRSKRRRTKR